MVRKLGGQLTGGPTPSSQRKRHLSVRPNCGEYECPPLRTRGGHSSRRGALRLWRRTETGLHEVALRRPAEDVAEGDLQPRNPAVAADCVDQYVARSGSDLADLALVDSRR